MNHKTLFSVLSASTLIGSAAAQAVDPPGQAELGVIAARFAPVDIGADIDMLPTGERAALARLVEAARLMDGLFLRQVWAGNAALLVSLAADRSPLGRARLHYFVINKGPWSRLDHDTSFVPGVPAKPSGANYYPIDATREEVSAWIESLPPAVRAAATGFFTTIRRDADGELTAVPYSLEYQNELAAAARLLEEAASQSVQPTLVRYLRERARALATNDYYASDVAWMELDSTIEPTIGPYEVYEDEWFNYKAAFEAFVTIRDDVETAKLTKFAGELQELENHLPIDQKYRNPALGTLAPLRVVNVVFTAGDANRGVQTAAFNLPNDERVIRDKGSKRVMLKNVQEAKFETVLVPISKVVLAAANRTSVAFDAFFTHILMHELTHGLGPHAITAGGRPSTVRQELKETYSTIEEAKADISGLWALQYLIDKGTLDRSLERTIYTTFLASAFRSLRFGLNESHAQGMAIQLNRLLDAGAVLVSQDGTFSVDHGRVKDAVRDAAAELLTIEAEGRYDRAQTLIAEQAVVRQDVQRALDRLTQVPVDIEPRFVTAETLLNEEP